MPIIKLCEGCKGSWALAVEQGCEALILSSMGLSLGMSFEYELVEIILTAVDTEDIGKKMMRSCFQFYVESLGGTQGGVSQDQRHRTEENRYLLEVTQRAYISQEAVQ